MESIIEELYYGNICLSERSVRSGSELYKAQQLAARNEASLESSMSEAQKEARGKKSLKRAWVTAQQSLCCGANFQ